MWATLRGLTLSFARAARAPRCRRVALHTGSRQARLLRAPHRPPSRQVAAARHAAASAAVRQVAAAAASAVVRQVVAVAASAVAVVPVAADMWAAEDNRGINIR